MSGVSREARVCRCQFAWRVAASDRLSVGRSRAAAGHTPQELLAGRDHAYRAASRGPVTARVILLARALANYPA